MKARLSRWLIAIGAAASLATLTGFLGGSWWLLELSSHFRVQYALTLIVVATLLAAMRRWWFALALGTCAAVNVATIAPLYIGPELPAAPRGRTVRALLMNVHTANTDHAAVLAEVERTDPDLIVALEVDGVWLRALRPLAARYPHRLKRPRPDNFGIALLSRIPLRDARIVKIGSSGVPSIVAAIELDGERVNLLATHARPPASRRLARLRDEHLAAIPSFLARFDGEKVLLGDLNSTPWSPVFGCLLAESKLMNSARGFGVQATWPAHLPPLRIPIDHCLHSAGVVVLDRSIGRAIGSDHFPLIVEFALGR